MAYKKKDKFFDFLNNISLNLKKSATFFADFKINNVGDLKLFSETMKAYESEGDTMVHDLIKELNIAFITPIEREDILALAITMDDILNGLYHTASLFEMYSYIDTDDYISRFVNSIEQCTTEIDAAMALLSAKKLIDMRDHAIRIKEMETHCDNILRESIKHLFTVEKDPIRIIQSKSIYEGLEEITDYCKSVANTIEAIIMKNSHYF